MAFYTFTTISGSAATNNLVISVTNAVTSAGATTMSLVGGKVAFTNVQGNTTVTDWTPSNFAARGIPTQTAGGANIAMTLATFQASGVQAALQGAASIDAADATSSQIDAFIANSAGANASSLDNASVTASQFVSLVNLGKLAALGADSVDATDATASQIASMITNEAKIASGAIENADLLYSEFASFTAAKFATAGATIDASLVAQAGTAAMVTALNTASAKVAGVYGVSIAVGDLTAAFDTFTSLIEPLGITSVNAATFTPGNWTTLIGYRELIDLGSISGATTVSLANFLAIPNKFADGGVADALSLTGATSAEIDLVIENSAKIAASAIDNATLTPAQFSLLTTKIANGQATVDAADATAAEVTAILQNLAKFNVSLTSLTISPTQFTAATGAALSTAVGNGELTITASTAATLDASAFSKTLQINGSESGDYITGGSAANTIQGAKGLDVIIGGNTASLLKGGNGADTITGGDGADTIYGGNSINANVLTGGAGADKFYTNGGLNSITDLGVGGVADVVVVSSGVTTNATVTGDWTATSATVNAGTMTATADSTGRIINVAAAGVGNGFTLVGNAGVDTITGSSYNDSISGGDGADTIAGGAGANTITGGAAADKITTSGSADVITDLGAGGSGDILINSGTVTATTTGNWTAGANTANTGTVSITVGNGYSVNLANDSTGTAGYTISAAGNYSGSSLTGAAQADTITGGNGDNTLSGAAGVDSITGGAGDDEVTGGSGADILVGGSGADDYNYTVVGQGGNVSVTNTTVLTAGDTITGFVSGTDDIDVSALAAGTVATQITGSVTSLSLSTYGAVIINNDTNFVAGTSAASVVSTALNAAIGTITMTDTNVGYVAILDANGTSADQFNIFEITSVGGISGDIDFTTGTGNATVSLIATVTSDVLVAGDFIL